MEEFVECFFCGRRATERHHMLHGSANRKLAEKDGLVVALCQECHRRLHDNGENDKELEKFAELVWLKNNPNRTIEDFTKKYGKNFL